MSARLSEMKEEETANTRPLSWRLICRIFANFGPYKWVLFSGNALCLVCALCDMAIIREIRKLIDHPKLLTGSLFTLFGPLVLLVFLNRFCGWSQWLVTLAATNRAVETLRLKFFTKLQSLSKRFYDSHKSGWLIARNTGDMFQISNFLNFSLMMMVYFTTSTVFAFREMSALSPVLLLPTLIIVPIVFVVTRQFQTKMSYAQRSAREQNSKLVANLSESVKAFP